MYTLGVPTPPVSYPGCNGLTRVFVDRAAELEALESAWELRPALIVVYGRRRVGKTALVLEWARRMRRRATIIYYHATMASHEVNLRDMARAVEEAGVEGFSKPTYPSLDALLETLSYRVGDAAIVIDEFTYWVRSEPRVASELQRFTDNTLPRTKLLIVLVGSLVGVMYRAVIGGGAPLYGRARLRLRVRPLKPWYTPLLHPRLTLEDAVRVYALLGGVPYYHALARPEWSLREIIEKLLASRLSPLKDEPWFLLREEFRDPHAYFSILEAIAEGHQTPGKIAEYTGIPRHHVTRYLHVLEELEFVERIVPLGRRRGWYTIRDPLLRTWFRLIRPNLERIEAGLAEEATRVIMDKLDVYTAEVFEADVAREYVRWLASQGRIRASRVTRYTHKDIDIDIVAVDEESKTLHAFEVKWANLDHREAERIARSLRRRLEEAAEKLGYKPGKAVVIARSAETRSTPDAEIHTLRDMPFEKPGQGPR